MLDSIGDFLYTGLHQTVVVSEIMERSHSGLVRAIANRLRLIASESSNLSLSVSTKFRNPPPNYTLLHL